MKKTRILGLALFAVFAFSAVAATSAFAVSEWLVAGAVVATPLAADTTGSLILNNKSILGTIVVECSGLFEGTIGAGAADSVTKLFSLTGETGIQLGTGEKALDCTVTTGNAFCGAAGSLAEVWPLNLTAGWVTKIELEGTTFVDDFPTNSGYEVKCSTGVTNKCEGLAHAILKNVATGVEGTFTEASSTVNCENGTGFLTGSGITTSTGGLVSVS